MMLLKNIKNLLLILKIFIFILISWNCSGNPPVIAPEPKPELEKTKIPLLEPIAVEPPKPPEKISVILAEYDLEKMTIKWHSSKENDFKNYLLLTRVEGDSIVDTLSINPYRTDTVFQYQNFDPTLQNWYWIIQKNTSDLESVGESITHMLETDAPAPTTLFDIEFFDQLIQIKWSKNYDLDFSTYDIIRSPHETMKDKRIIKQFHHPNDTSFVIPLDSIYYYQIGVSDKWGLKSFSNTILGDYHVTILDQEYSLIGTKELDLSSRKIFGQIPKDIFDLINVEYLRLQNNYFSGSIPDQLWEMPKLRSLNLSNNEFTGTIPRRIHRSRSLEELWLSNNQFYGEIPYQLYLLKDLTHLDLSVNKLVGDISESVGDLLELEYINFWDNNLEGVIPKELGQLKKLEFLSLAGNNLTGGIPKELGSAHNLTSIALFENQLVGQIPHELTNLLRLNYLGLFENELEGEVPQELISSMGLLYCRLNENNFNLIDYESICRSTYDWDNTIFFDLSNNSFEKPLPVCLHGSELFEIHKYYNKKNN